MGNKDRENARTREWEKANPERVKATKTSSYERNKVKQLSLAAEKRASNPEKYRARVLRSMAAHQSRVKVSRKRYKKENPHRARADRAKRKAMQLQATPVWANYFFIEEAYRLAVLRTKMLGMKWEVDHTVPLRSKIVCGLHVENNLRVIPAVANWKKGNRYWPDMPQG